MNFYNSLRMLGSKLVMLALLLLSITVASAQTAYVAVNGETVPDPNNPGSQLPVNFSIRAVDLTTGQTVANFNNLDAPPIEMATSPDGSSVVGVGTFPSINGQPVNSVYFIDPNSNSISEVGDFNFGSLRNLGFNTSGNTVYTVDALTTLISPYSPASQSLSGSFGFLTSGTNPVSVAVNPITQDLVIVNIGSSNLATLNSSLSQFGTNISVQGSQPQDIVFAPGTQTAYVSVFSPAQISIVDLATRSVTGTITGLSSPTDLAITPDGSTLYVVNDGLGTVSVVDLNTNTVVGTIPVGSNPTDVTVSADGSIAVVVNSGSGSLSVISTSSNTVTNTISGIGSNPIAVAIAGAADVNEPPTASFIATPTSGEAPLLVNFNASGSSDSDGTIASYSWDFGDGNNGSGVTTSNNYTNPGTYTVTLTVTDDDGDTDMFSTTITVTAPNQAPTASFTATPTSGEAPLNVNFNASASSDSDGTIASYSWDFGDGNSSTGVSASNTYTSAGTFTVTLTVTDDDGATDTATETITVTSPNQNPTASFTATPTSGDAPLNVNFDANASSDPDGTIASYGWDFGDGNTGTGVTTSNTYTVAGTYTVTLTVTDNDGATAIETETITVNEPVDPIIRLLTLDTDAETVVIRNFGTVSENISNYQLCLGPGEYNQIGGYSSIIGDLNLSPGEEVTLNLPSGNDNVLDLPATGALGLFSSANFGSNSPDDLEDFVQWGAAGGNRVGQAVAAGRWDSASNFVGDNSPFNYIGGANDVGASFWQGTPNQLPSASFTATPTSGEAPLNVSFNASASSDSDGTIASYSWDFGDGNSGTGVTTSNNYTTPGTYTVTLTVTDNNGGTDTATETITVDAPNVGPTASFTATPTTGEAPLNVNFNASASSDSDGTIASYSWDFGDGNTGTGVVASNNYTTPGTYTVTLTVTDNDGATDSATETITVVAPNVAPTASLIATPLTGEAPLNVNFDASGSSDSDGTIVEYDFDFADGNTSVQGAPTVSNTYTAPGTYIATVTVTDNDGAIATASVTIVVEAPNQAPVADLVAFPITGDAPLAVDFDGTGSTDADGTIVEYAFDFGDGNTSTGGTATASNLYNTAGTFTASLTVTDEDGATNSVSVTITVTEPNQAPTASFTALPTSGTVQLTVDVNASASSDSDGTITSYAWDFGNGQSATGQTASVTYQTAGTFIITLTVTDDDGATDTATETIVVSDPQNEAPTASFTVSPESGPTPLAVTVDASGSSDSDGTITSYAWDFGDGNTATGITAGNTYDLPGVYTITLTVTDNDDAVGTTTQTVVVENRAPTADIAADVTEGEAPLTVNFDGSGSVDPDGTISTYAWNFGDGNTGVGPMPSNTFTAAGVYTVSLTVIDNNGQTGTATVTITVTEPMNQAPMADIVADPTSGDAPLTVSFDASGSTDADGTIVAYAWNFGDADNSTAEGPIVTFTYDTPGTYVVTLTVVDDDNTTGMATVTITVNEPAVNVEPIADFTATPTSGLAPLEVSFDASASSDPDGTIASYSWDFGDGNTGAGVTTTNTYAAAGTYTVTLIVTDNEGASASSTATITVEEEMVNVEPVADFIATPTSGVAPLGVSFDGSLSSDSDGTIVEYAWDFGDGNTGSGANTSNTYTAAGVYTVTLTVTDNDGATATATGTITVEEAGGGTLADVLQEILDESDIVTNTGLDFGGLTATVVTSTEEIDVVRGQASVGISFSEADRLGIADVSQTVYSVLTHGLSQEGALTLDQPISDFIDVADLSGISGDITIDQLLKHTSGLGEFSDNENYESTLLFDVNRIFTEAEILELFLGDAGTPGTFSYANTNFLVLGLVLEAANGTESLRETLGRLVVTPLGLDADQIGIYGTADPAPNFGALFADVFGTGFLQQLTPNTSVFTGASSAGNIYGQPNALINMLRTVLTTEDVLSAESQASILDFMPAEGRLSEAYGRGVEQFNLDIDGVNLDFIGHVGDINYGGVILYSLEAETGVYLGTNNASVTEEQILELARQLLDAAIDGTQFQNQAPTADFDADPMMGDAPLTVNFDASASSDPDGTIASYAWDFGDGNTGTGVTIMNEYTAPGTYTVTLTVTDNDGATATATKEITVNEVTANQDPIADFVADPMMGDAPLTVNFDASASSDPDGTIASYAWDFGDGNTGTGVMTSNEYTAAGTYTVTLTVTDNEGATATATKEITVNEVVTNQDPIASFTATPTSGIAPLDVAFDASASSDPDGTIASYAWDFGDGNTGTGVMAMNTYAAPGTYTATLTVTDNEGATATSSTTIMVTAEPGEGPDVQLSVTPSVTDLVQYENVVMTIKVENVGGQAATGITVSTPVPAGFAFAGSNATQGQFDLFSQTWTVGDLAAGEMATLELSIFVLNPANPTVYFSQVLTASPEDVDSSPGNNDGNTPNEDDEAAVSLNFDPAGPNRAPIAVFTAGPTSGFSALISNFNAISSIDLDGTIVDYAWDFGDGNTANGIEATNTFVAAGTYTVTLTVTDNDGATGTASQIITVEDGSNLNVDLELGLTASTTELVQYENVTLTFTVTNTGTDAAQGVVVSAIDPEGLAFVSATAFQGTYNLFFEEWTIDQIGAGETVTLELVLFVVNPAATLEYYAQILAANPTDVDSTPDNNDGPTPSEDDEAVVTFNFAGFNLQAPNSNDLLLENTKQLGEGLAVYPNPANEELFLDLTPFQSKSGSYQIFDGAGKLVTSQDLGAIQNAQLTINLVDMKSGLYVITFKAGEATYSKRFVIQR